MLPPNPFFPVFLVFCRIGGCLMVTPGFSSDRIPIQARLYFALAVTLAVAPALLGKLQPGSLSLDSPTVLLMAIITELTVGVTLGYMARLYFLALEMLSTATAMAFGLGNIFGAGLTEPEPAPTLTSFVLLCALTLVFCTDLHLETIRGLFLSYETAPLLAATEIGALLEDIMRILTDAHLLALRISSPFLLFALVVNIALGLLARLTPQVQIYFIMTPAVIFLSIGAFFLLGWDFFAGFISHFGASIQRG